MSDFLKRTWAQVDLSALRHNYREIRRKVRPEAKIMAVVKADCYGHGAEYCAKTLESCGAEWFAVSNLEEACQLRSCGIDKPILILGYTPPECAAQLWETGISQAVFSEEYAEKLSQAADEAGAVVNIHLKIDTGMGRLGLLYYDGERDAEAVRAAVRICGRKGLRAEGIFTHFASADETEGEEFTRLQFRRFTELTDRLADAGVTGLIRHCCNSAGSFRFPEMNLDMVRPGIILYGLDPSGEVKGYLDLHPVMSLKSVVSHLKEVGPGMTVSYGRTFTAKEPMRVATVPIGYADGYNRLLSGRADMLVNGRRARVVGRVCMDQLMLNVTGIPDVSAGREVTVFGSEGGKTVSVDELASLCGTINYETVCLIGKRVPRIYFENGREVGQMNLLVSPEE